MESSVIRRIHALRQMTVGELQVEWQRALRRAVAQPQPRLPVAQAEPGASRNWPTAASATAPASGWSNWRPTGFQRARTPAVGLDVADLAPVPRRVRDLRMPVVGSVITKTYKGRELRVVVRDGGFEFEGAVFASLSALAREITGSTHINGKLFFGLVTERKR